MAVASTAMIMATVALLRTNVLPAVSSAHRGALVAARLVVVRPVVARLFAGLPVDLVALVAQMGGDSRFRGLQHSEQLPTRDGLQAEMANKGRLAARRSCSPHA